MTDFTFRIAGCKVFSKIGLKKGYHQIHMNQEDMRTSRPITHSATAWWSHQLKDTPWILLATTKWPQHLPWVMLGLQAAAK